MTREEAIAEATRRNRILREQGETVLWIEVQRADGEWDVDARPGGRESRRRAGGVLDVLLTLLTGWGGPPTGG